MQSVKFKDDYEPVAGGRPWEHDVTTPPAMPPHWGRVNLGCVAFLLEACNVAICNKWHCLCNSPSEAAFRDQKIIIAHFDIIITLCNTIFAAIISYCSSLSLPLLHIVASLICLLLSIITSLLPLLLSFYYTLLCKYRTITAYCYIHYYTIFTYYYVCHYIILLPVIIVIMNPLIQYNWPIITYLYWVSNIMGPLLLIMLLGNLQMNSKCPAPGLYHNC